MESSATRARQAFCTSLLRHLRVVYSDRTAGLSQATLAALMDWAADCGICLRYDVQRLAELLLEHRLPLDVRPTNGWIADVLARSYPSGTDKLNDLLEVELQRAELLAA